MPGSARGPAAGGPALRTLRVVAALVALGTLKAAWTMLFARAEFLAAFPGLAPAGYAPMLALVAANFAAAVGAVLRFRWAAVALVGLGLVTIAADVWVRGPAFHLVMSVVLMLVVAPAAWFARDGLR